MKTRRRESRESWSFKHFPTALRACALRLDPNASFDPVRSTFVVDEVIGDEGQYVEVSLELNVESVADRAQVNLEDLEWVLLYSNAESRRVSPLWRSSASRHPRKWSGRIPSWTLSRRRYELVLQLILARERPQRRNLAWRQGSVLADRLWTITSPTASSLFTVDWTCFSEREGWDRDAVWRVEFAGSDAFDAASPEETVRLHVNKDLEALTALFSRSGKRSPRLGPFTNVLVPVVLSGVTVEILARVLRWAHPLIGRGELDPSELDPDCLAGRVFDAVEKLGLDAAEAARVAVEEPGRLAMLVQGHFKIGQSLSGAALERMRRT